MKKSRFREEQMVAILREADRGTVAEVARKHKVSEQTDYSQIGAARITSHAFGRFKARFRRRQLRAYIRQPAARAMSESAVVLDVTPDKRSVSSVLKEGRAHAAIRVRRS